MKTALAQPVASNVYRIPLAWSNAYLLIEDDVASLIDTGLSKDLPLLLAALSELGILPNQIGSVLLTHAHCDHAGNASFFASHGSHIFCHEAETPFLTYPMRTYAQTGPHMLLRPLAALSFIAGERIYPVARISKIAKVRDGTTLDVPGGQLRIIASYGHTPGHVAFYRPHDSLLFSGDAIMNIIPVRRITGLSLPIRLLSTNWADTIQSAKRLASLHPSILLSGHGYSLSENAAEQLDLWARNL